jgi:D-amino-acid dehydrogenase
VTAAAPAVEASVARGADIGAHDGAHVVVVGAGVIGACIALRLRQRGVRTTLVDRDEPGRGCSFGNSGAISPGSVAPLAMPGILRSVPGMLLDPESPLYLPAGYLPRALPWLVRFAASARPGRVARTADALAALHADAVGLHMALARDAGVPDLVVRRGHLHLYPDAEAARKDAATWRLRAAHGYRFAALDRDGILALEPAIGPRYTHGLFLADHATIVDPFRYVQAIANAAVARGATLRRADVTALRQTAGGWSVEAGAATLSCTHVVVAAGAWSKRLLAPLGVPLALESQRGYHVQYRGPAPVSRTVVLADRKVFVTPMSDGLRVGGTVEIGGLDAPPDPRRAALLARIAAETFPALASDGATTWMGHRPCMPDSLPVIGPVDGRPGLLLAVGHGHLGMTDSVRTAERIAGAIH